MQAHAAKHFGAAAILCFAYAGVALVAVHLLRSDFSPASHMISDYAVGPYAWVMQSAFIGMSAGCAMLLAGLARSGPGGASARIAVVLLAVASLGLIVSSMFPTDLVGQPRTMSGKIHAVSFLVNIASIFIAIALLTASFGSDQRWRPYRRTSLLLLCGITAAFVAQFLTLRKGAPYGIANKALVFMLGAWFVATAYRLRNMAVG